MICKAVLFDVIGTTVKEKDPETINNCFVKAFADNNVSADSDLFKANRGKDKLEVIHLILNSLTAPLLCLTGRGAVSDLTGHSPDISLADAIYNSFTINVKKEIENFSPAEDADAIFNFLRQRSIKIGLGTGLSRDLFEKILARVKWDKKLFDYIGIASEIGKSRPHPDMIFDFMHVLKIVIPEEILKVGDTIADIQEGKNAKVTTAAILAGTQTKEELMKENPDFIINTLSEIQNIIHQ